MEKIVLITGATGGIGFATAKAFGRDGYRVLMADIDDSRAESCMAQLKSLSIPCDYYHIDVTDELAVNEQIARIATTYDHLDAVVNNAGGLGGRSRFDGMTTEFYRSVLALNLDSAFFVSRACIPLLKKGNAPSIINFASNAAWNAGGPGAGVYGTAKAAVVTLTRALAKDLAEFGIRVNGVSPGTIDTPFHAGIKATNPALFQTWKNNILMKRFGEPEEVAEVVSFLCSDKASFLTGEIIQVNGGQDLL
jgi:meso-butanediol dehydrogenase / (S,S)-butanediol dehydrogenase / diacetyl reductase